nr:xylulose kinase-1 [Tanacetum cinerariifolium]
MIKVLPPKTAKEVMARESERKARTTLLMALPEDHLAKFHKMVDAKEMWEAIKSRFGGYDESKKMQNYLLKQQFKGFFVSILEGPHKGDGLKMAVAMISIRIKKFHKRTGRKLQFNTKDPAGFNKTKVECFNCHKIGHFTRYCRAKENQDSRRRDDGYNGNKTKDNGRRPAYQDDSKALVTIDGEYINWSGHDEEDAQNYAMMAYSSSNSGSENDLKSCSKACEESYARLKKLYDDQGEKLGDASVDITAYTLSLKRLLNTQINANDKFGLGYGDYRYGSILSYENEALQSVFMNKASDLEDTPVNDRFTDGINAVPLPMIENYMPYGPDVEINYFKFTYGLKQTSADESDSKPSEYASCESDSSVKTSISMPKPIENASKVICEPKVWTDAPIIEEYESDNDNDSVSNVQQDK